MGSVKKQAVQTTLDVHALQRRIVFIYGYANELYQLGVVPMELVRLVVAASNAENALLAVQNMRHVIVENLKDQNPRLTSEFERLLENVK